MLKRVIVILAVSLFLVLVGFVAYVNSRQISEAELAQRCAASRPEWQNYQEDIKAQIGARPVAQWKGDPIAARQSGNKVYLTFRLEGPWARYDLVLPILLRDPLGKTYRSITAEYRGPERTYLFDLSPDAAASVLPWVEVRYPHTETRLSLNPQGQWKK